LASVDKGGGGKFLQTSFILYTALCQLTSLLSPTNNYYPTLNFCILSISWPFLGFALKSSTKFVD